MTTPLQVELTARTGLLWKTDTPEEYYAQIPETYYVWRFYPRTKEALVEPLTIGAVYRPLLASHKGLTISEDMAKYDIADRRPVRDTRFSVRSIDHLVAGMEKKKPRPSTLGRYCPDRYNHQRIAQVTEFLPFFKRLELRAVETDSSHPDLDFRGAGNQSVLITRYNTRIHMSFTDSRMPQLVQLVAESIAEKGKFTTLDFRCDEYAVITIRLYGKHEDVRDDFFRLLSTPLGKYIIVQYNTKFQEEADK